MSIVLCHWQLDRLLCRNRIAPPFVVVVRSYLEIVGHENKSKVYIQEILINSVIDCRSIGTLEF